jgi:hypothetical protein
MSQRTKLVLAIIATGLSTSAPNQFLVLPIHTWCDLVAGDSNALLNEPRNDTLRDFDSSVIGI